MISILVTGSNGQLGRSIQKIEADYPELQLVFKDARGLDITDNDKIDSVFSKHQFDYCINCAAYTDVEQAEKNPEKAFLINADSVRALALACRDYNVVLIHISTDYVFDGEKKTPYKTTDLTNPINVYGASKLKGEEYVREVSEKHFIVRTSWLYSEFGKNFYTTIHKKAKSEKVLQVTDEQTGCPTYARNLAKYLLDLIESDSEQYGIHHFTDGEAMTWNGFAKKILIENGLEDSVIIEKAKNYRTFAKRPKYSVLAAD